MFAWENAVFKVQSGIYIFASSTGACLEETLFEIITEEGVQNRIHGRIRVTKTSGDEEYDNRQPGLALFGWCEYEGHLGHPVG